MAAWIAAREIPGTAAPLVGMLHGSSSYSEREKIRGGWSRAQDHRAAGITQASVSNYETGKREVTLATAMGLAAALDVTFCQFVDLETDHLIIPAGSRLARAVGVLEESPEPRGPSPGVGRMHPPEGRLRANPVRSRRSRPQLKREPNGSMVAVITATNVIGMFADQ